VGLALLDPPYVGVFRWTGPRCREPRVIETVDLTKKYGDFTALAQFSLKLEQGDVFGFIGPNGAGKTTTMRILATLLNPTWGEAYVCGHSIYTAPKEIRRLIGYMPDAFGVYEDLTVLEYLEFFAAAYRIRGPARRKRCDELLELVDLDFKRDAYADKLSRGQTQRLGLARVLLHDPQVLLLDEPASGLDPRARIEMRHLLKRLGGLGKTIMVSSHILPELADICNKIGIIDRGRLVVSAAVDDVMNQVRSQTVLHVSVAGDQALATAALATHELVESASADNGEIIVRLKPTAADHAPLAKFLVDRGFALCSFKREEITLETAFMRLTKGAVGE
jgi:ABC-2 type transport system ATP-binding protein